jgi:hypothetical protein
MFAGQRGGKRGAMDVGRTVKEKWWDYWRLSLGFSLLGAGAMLVMG